MIYHLWDDVCKGNTIRAIDGLSLSDTVNGDLLQTVFKNGDFENTTTFAEIRGRLK